MKRGKGQSLSTLYLKRIAQLQIDVIKGSTHDWEWTAPDSRRAYCMVCGLQLLVKVARAAKHEGADDHGWKRFCVWGGNDEGIGGLLKEPRCTQAAGGVANNLAANMRRKALRG
jgi:hypothetical protein